MPNFRGAFLRGYGGIANYDIGALQQSAAPNIIGSFIADSLTGNVANVSGALYGISPSSTYRAGNESGNNRNTQLWFDASRSSAVYGRSNIEVRPENYAIRWFIKY